MSRTELILSLIMNGIVFLVTLGIVISYFIVPTGENRDKPPSGIKSFRFYTTDSNVFSGITCMLVFFAELPEVFRSGGEQVFGLYPHWLTLLKFMSTCTVVITFLTVMCFLGPTQGYKTMLGGTSFHMHLAGPILAFISLCFLEDFHSGFIIDKGYISVEEAFVAIVPTVIYELIYLRQVIFVRYRYMDELGAKVKDMSPEEKENLPGWPDFYGFNIGGKWSVSLFVMTCLAISISLIIRTLYNM